MVKISGSYANVFIHLVLHAVQILFVQQPLLLLLCSGDLAEDRAGSPMLDGPPLSFGPHGYKTCKNI